MQPVVRRHATDADMPAAQNFLPNERDHDGVINIVVDSVAGRDIFESKLREQSLGSRDSWALISRTFARTSLRSSRINASITISVGLNIGLADGFWRKVHGATAVASFAG